MGWMQSLWRDEPTTTFSPTSGRGVLTSSIQPKALGSTEHIEFIAPQTAKSGQILEESQRTSPPPPPKAEPYPFLPPSTPDAGFCFIPPSVVASKCRPGALSVHEKHRSSQHEQPRDYWIVIDDMVYDCSSFVDQHPGGEQVILSFLGQDCSWQFWRFHNKEHMRVHGRPLRIGRTEGVPNRFKEQPRFVGLKQLGNDEW